LIKKYSGLPGFLARFAFLVLLVGFAHVEHAAAQSCSTNAITAENCLAGNPASEWDLPGGGIGDGSIQGYASQISVNRGSSISFKIDTPATAYRIDIYRLGYYGGAGARKVATINPSVSLPQTQPDCLSNSDTGLVDCGNWSVSATWAVPANAVSGVYIARPVRTDDGSNGASHIPFIVRDDSSSSSVLYKTSDTTWQAYNDYGGNSLYSGAPAGRAYKVSYNRPMITRGNQYQRANLFGAEYPMIRWLEANGYDVSYISSVDADRTGSLLLNHDVALSVGHDEYWSAAERNNYEAARNAGVNLAFFSGNEVFWKVRWENSIDPSATAYRTLVSYKETHAGAKIDPSATWTGTWRDPRFSPPSDGGRPENALTGTIFTVNCCSGVGIEVPSAEGKMRLWRNTSVASLSAGQVATLSAGTLGYEWDEDLDNGFRPQGLIRLSSTTVANANKLQDYGSNYANGTATHSLTMYKHSSGALVFSAGSVRWSWGLDATHDLDSATPGTGGADVRVQQATVNLFADMGVTAGTLQSGLVQTTQTTDVTRPTTVMTTPAAGANIGSGQNVTISGTASDVGGQVAGVEVSTDNGATWHPATGRASWSYSWTAGTPGAVTLRARAIDDSGNIETPGVSRSITVGAATCPCSAWDSSATPANLADPDGLPVELGVKFRTDIAGSITGIRFYKSTTNTGTHIGNLWSASGQLLATGTFSGESASGWQQMTFTSPVSIAANTVYVASYFAPNGHFSYDSGYFNNSGVDRGQLHLLQNGVSGGNGVFLYGAASAFPTNSFNGSNYWVDVVFSTSGGTPPDTTAPTITGRSPASGATNVGVASPVTVTFSESMDSSTISGSTIELRNASNTLIASTVTYDATSFTATLTPTASLALSSTYTVTVRGGATDPRVKDVAGNALAANSAWSFTTSGSSGCPCTGFDPSAVPAVPADTDPAAVEVGVKFRTDVDGQITGIRFYKGTGNGGTHIGSLWSVSGTLLGSATFTGETATGWQQVNFPTPINVTANTVYVASYFAPQGHYAYNSGFFLNAGVDRGVLHLLQNGVSGGNGVYSYGTSSTFPINTFNGNNYWVDVVLTTQAAPPADTTPPTISSRTPASGATNVVAGTVVTATFNEALDASTVNGNTFQLRDGSNVLVPATVTYDNSTFTATLTPTATLGSAQTYNVTVRGGTTDPRIKDVAGNALAATATWSFTTANALNNVNGVWSALGSWPLIAVHAVLNPDGRVLTYGTNGAGQQTGFFIYDVWNPNAGGIAAGHTTLPNQTNTDLFCSSQLVLPQSGNVFLAGGDNWTGTATTNTGNNNSNVFSLANSTIARGNNMNRARWYSTSTMLANGEIYIQGGTSGEDRPEIRDATGAFRLMSGINTSTLSATYPRNWVAPDGRIFGFDNAGKMYFVTTSGTGSIQMLGNLPGTTAWTASAVMYRPGKIIQMGGGSNAALTIDINGPVPVVASTTAMNTRRQWVTATVLPNGRVLATGGSEVDNALTNVNNTAAIWNPDTGAWTLGTAGAVARLYHSTALLLPDATVLIAGGGAPGPLVNTNAEIYSPPYLFDSTGALAPRPTISSSPDVLDIGSQFFVQYSSSSNITKVVLIKTGAITHSWNMDQRYLELPFTVNGNILDVTAPTRASDATPGYYMLFLLNANGVPSKAKILKINVQSFPVVGADFTPSVGDATAGTAFTLACNASEALVGIYGTSGTQIQQVGPRCVPLDQTRKWIGTPVNRGLAGTSVGAAYTKTCATNSVVSAFRGRASTTVFQLDIECKTLDSAGKLTGTGTYLGAVGGTGGSAVGPFSCGTNNPGGGIFGRANTNVVNFGLTCKTAPVTNTNVPPSVTNPGALSTAAGTPVSRQIVATDANGDALTFSATGLPTGLSISTSGLITGTPTVPNTYSVTVTVADPFSSTPVTFSWTITGGSAPLSLNPLPATTITQVNTAINYTATSQNGINPKYKWNFDDGTPETAFSSTAAISHTFTAPGVYYVTVTATDDRNIQVSQTVAQTIRLPLTANRPNSSSNIAVGTGGTSGRVWVVNQDNDTVSVFDNATNARLAETPVGTDPRSVAIAPDGRVWVTNKTSGTISVLNATTFGVVQTITLPYGSQPYGLVFSPTGDAGYVSLEGLGRVLRLDPNSGSTLSSITTGLNVRGIAINAAGNELYVSRFITPKLPGEETAVVQTVVGGVQQGAEVLVIATGPMTLTKTMVLQHSAAADTETSGGGVPNYLGAPTISPDNSNAWVPSKQDNIKRGTLRSGANINFQNTVRAVASRITVSTDTEDFAHRIDLDNSSVSSAATFDRNGVYLFVALETSREVAVVDPYNSLELFRFDVGRAPQGLAVSADNTRLYVNNFMDRTVTVYNLTNLINNGDWNVPLVSTWGAVVTEKLAANVLNGKQLFYDARDPRLARDRYMSCASCHNDGGADGRTWDLTGQGEGLRNTIRLRGRAGGQGLLHWSGNFDEVQDFEGQIRTLAGGSGLMTDAQFNAGTRSQPLGDPKTGVSTDLDALAAYLQSLQSVPASPFRNTDGSMTADAIAGKALFESGNCVSCHNGPSLTDSAPNNLHNIGTIKSTSGTRLGGALTGIDTPTLRDVWMTAPYLHDGSAATLGDAVRAHNNVTISDADLAKVVAFLQQVETTTVNSPAGGITAFNASDVPANPADTDSNAVTLGVKFRSTANGFITGIRFYKGAGNGGTHVGSLWTSTGTLLATGTFTGETATGWQQLNFTTPVAITANTVYVASYFAPQGHYAYNSAFFANSGVDKAPLRLLQNGESGGNGVYMYGASSTFPTNTFNSNNYWVDVVYSP
jgi:YVTN family beta-propeller protein